MVPANGAIIHDNICWLANGGGRGVDEMKCHTHVKDVWEKKSYSEPMHDCVDAMVPQALFYATVDEQAALASWYHQPYPRPTKTRRSTTVGIAKDMAWHRKMLVGVGAAAA